jgi:hypothetical protein
MALRKLIFVEGSSTVQTPYGSFDDGRKNVAVDAYIKVVEVTSTKEQAVAKVVFSNDKVKFEKSYIVTVSVSDGAKNFIAQVYEQLKTSEEFAGATDC